MLGKNAYKILGVIASMAAEGENLVVEKQELLIQSGLQMTYEELDKHMERLEVNDLIVMRYSDATVYCVALKTRGRLIAEQNRREEMAAAAASAVVSEEQPNYDDLPDMVTEEPAQFTTKQFKLMAIICGAASFAGGLLAAIVAFLIARFG